jgi:hypothetical protein
MNICLAGAHRVGKSTLAKAIAEHTGWTFIPSRTVEAFQRRGIDISRIDMRAVPPLQRLEIQEDVLDMHEHDLWAQFANNWIADRSALDMATYATLELLGNKDTPEDRALAYIERCFAVANTHCGSVLLIQPGIPYVAAPGKPPPSRLYQEAFNTHLAGLLTDRRMKVSTAINRRDCLTLDDRVRAVLSTVSSFAAITQQKLTGTLLC